jgi:small subunit ribosomal protein S16
MAVKIRLTRKGKKHQPTYRVVVADSRSPRDGRFIEQIGRYDPRQEPSLIEIDTERASYWLANGAQPSDQVRKLLEIAGALAARPVKDRKVHVVGEEAQLEAEAEAAAQVVDEPVTELVEDVDDLGDEPADAAEAPIAEEPVAEEPVAEAASDESVESSDVEAPEAETADRAEPSAEGSEESEEEQS